jgi:hypothetical protein
VRASAFLAGASSGRWRGDGRGRISRFVRLLLNGLVVCVYAVACATGQQGRFAPLRDGLNPAEVEALWGPPSTITQYEDSSGHQVHWEYRKRHVGERRYWAVELQPTAHGQVPTLERRGIPHSGSYLAAIVTFRDNQVIRWGTFPPPP